MRCLALAQAWKDSGGRVTFITTCRSDGILQRLREEGFDIHQISNPYPAPEDWALTGSILAKHPDAWLMLDGFHFDEIYQQRVKAGGNRLLAIDDLALLKHYYADIVLNQNVDARHLRYSCEPYTKLLLGTDYILLRREFLVQQSRKRVIPDVAKRVLVTLGGIDLNNYTQRVVQALQKIVVRDLEVTVLIGDGNPHVQTLEESIVKSQVSIKLLRDARDMPALMAQSDIAVTAGGISLWEMAFMGLPCLVMALVDNQRKIVRLMNEKHMAPVLIVGTDVISRDTISTKLAALVTDKKERECYSRALTSLVDGMGSSRVLTAMSLVG